MDKLRNIRRHHWKERLKISKIAKFGSNLLKTNEDIAPQKCEISQTAMVGAQTCPPPYQRLKIITTLHSYIFARLRPITFKPCSFTNFKALFPVVTTDVP